MGDTETQVGHRRLTLELSAGDSCAVLLSREAGGERHAATVCQRWLLNAGDCAAAPPPPSPPGADYKTTAREAERGHRCGPASSLMRLMGFRQKGHLRGLRRAVRHPLQAAGSAGWRACGGIVLCAVSICGGVGCTARRYVTIICNIICNSNM